jgi:N-formylglutamate deformylase
MAFQLTGEAGTSPLVFDSPHSWPQWPDDGTPPQVPRQVLQSSWDAYVDELWAIALDGSAPLLAARFHRACIDANRGRDDIDPHLLQGAWPTLLNPTRKSAVGMGLIRRDALPGVPMYAGKLPAAEVRERIERYYDPYHAELERLIAAAHGRFGFACHVDCHSMKSVGNAMNDDAGRPRPDVVVSDLDGRSSAREFTAYVAAGLAELGLHVQVNDPYKGAELIRRHGRPPQARHSVQIEINRALYMDEKTFEKTAGFERLAADLRRWVRLLRAELEGELGALLSSRETR